MRLEMLGVEIEDGADLSERRAFAVVMQAGGRHQLPDLRILRGKLHRLAIGLRGMIMAAEAGQGMTEQRKAGGADAAFAPRCLGQFHRAGKIALAQRQQNRRIAQTDIGGTGGDPHRQGSSRRVRRAVAILRHCQAAIMRGVLRIIGHRLAQAGDRIGRAPERDQKHAEHLLGAGIGRIENDGLRSIVRGGREVAEFHPHARPALAQAGMGWRGGDGKVECLQGFGAATLGLQQPRLQLAELRGRRLQSLQRLQQRPGGRAATGTQHRLQAIGQDIGVDGRAGLLHAGSF